MTIAEWIVNLAMIYAAFGIVFAIAFIIVGIGKIDAAAKDAPVMFRLLVLPGVAALWPLLLNRWLGGQTHPPTENNPHRTAAGSSNGIPNGIPNGSLNADFSAGREER